MSKDVEANAPPPAYDGSAPSQQQTQGAPPPQSGAYPPYPQQQQGAYPPQQQQGAYPPQQGPYPPGSYPQQQYAQGQPMMQQPVVVVAAGPRFSKYPLAMVCPNCQANIQTTVSYEIGLFTWLVVGSVCLVFFPAMCIPCCINDLKDVKHTCPSCKTFLGEYKIM